MPIALIGRIVAGIGVLIFGTLLFRGMVSEWHRRDDEVHAQKP